MSWSIRPAVPGDAKRISEITFSALGYPCDEETVSARLCLLAQRDTDRVFVAVRDADGSIGGYLHTADYETVYHQSQKNILALAVDEPFRGLGLGKMLLNAAESWARSCGCEAVRLVSSFPRTNAHQFYLHCGYALRKEQKNFIKRFT